MGPAARRLVRRGRRTRPFAPAGAAPSCGADSAATDSATAWATALAADLAAGLLSGLAAGLATGLATRLADVPFTLSGASAVISPAAPSRAASSRSLMRSQLRASRASSSPPRMRTSVQPPASLRPCRWNLSLPPANAPAGSGSSVDQVPRSHSTTSPAPYWRGGITPSKSPYSSGWSSVSTASRRSPGSRLGPLGTAQLRSTPSSSSRKS